MMSATSKSSEDRSPVFNAILPVFILSFSLRSLPISTPNAPVFTASPFDVISPVISTALTVSVFVATLPVSLVGVVGVVVFVLSSAAFAAANTLAAEVPTPLVGSALSSVRDAAPAIVPNVPRPPSNPGNPPSKM